MCEVRAHSVAVRKQDSRISSCNALEPLGLPGHAIQEHRRCSLVRADAFMAAACPHLIHIESRKPCAPRSRQMYVGPACVSCIVRSTARLEAGRAGNFVLLEVTRRLLQPLGGHLLNLGIG